MMNFNENPAQNILYNYAFEFIKEEICETRKLIDDYKLKEQKLQALKFKELSNEEIQRIKAIEEKQNKKAKGSITYESLEKSPKSEMRLMFERKKQEDELWSFIYKSQNNIKKMEKEVEESESLLQRVKALNLEENEEKIKESNEKIKSFKMKIDKEYEDVKKIHEDIQRLQTESMEKNWQIMNGMNN